MKHAILIVALVACGPKPAPRGPGGIAGLLAYIPADAPVVIATVDRVPFESIESLLMAGIYGYSEMALDVSDDGLVGTFYWELK
jgi:hypothetical protein